MSRRRNNFSAVRYKVYALLSCGHEWGPMSVLVHVYEGTVLFCAECQDNATAEAVESNVYTVGRGW